MKKISKRKILFSTILTIFSIFLLCSFSYAIDNYEDPNFAKRDKVLMLQRARDMDVEINEINNEIMKIRENLEEINKKYDYYLKGVRIYSPEKTKIIHSLNVAQKNRFSLRDAIRHKKPYKHYDSEQEPLIAYNYGNTPQKEEKLTKKEIDIMTNAILDVLNKINLKEIYLNDLLVYISPNSLKDSEALTYMLNKGSKDINGELIFMAVKQKDLTDDDYFVLCKEVFLHELGHVINGRYDYYNKVDLLNEYNNYYGAQQKTTDHLKGFIITDWAYKDVENFAEDFKVFAMRKLYNSKTTTKRTVYIYNKNIETILNRFMK